MVCRRLLFLSVGLCIGVFSCVAASAQFGPAAPSVSDETGADESGADESGTPAARRDQPADSAENPREPVGKDITEQMRKLNRQIPLPDAEFEPGHADPLEFDSDQITKTDQGFSIQLPSRSPVPTPTVYRGRLYVSGGFSSEEYYCFDAISGDLVWAVQLDDDGPSSAVPFQDSIIFSCESCTLFTLSAATGELQWAYWLGDPLLSMPTVAAGRVFAAYPATANVPEEAELPEDPQADAATEEIAVEPTHIAVCLDAKSGAVLWRRWLDSDCMTVPVASSSDVFFTTLTGTVHRFDLQRGRLRSAHRLRATSVPVPVAAAMYLTCRADTEPSESIAECVVRLNLNPQRIDYVTARRAAPWLDQAVQRQSAYSQEADAFEAPNGIGGGGFGGGFGGGGFGGGQFSVVDEPDAANDDPDQPADQAAAPPVPMDALGVTELQAADTIGLGNVSTLQGYQGSRILYRRGKLFSCMGDVICCIQADNGKVLWQRTIAGDPETTGGHLASPPAAAGDSLVVTTVAGQILRLSAETGEILTTFEIDGTLRFSPVLDRGRIYVGTQDGRVICINTNDPELSGWSIWGGDAARSNVAP